MTDTPTPGFDLERMRDYAKRGYAYPCADILALIAAYEAEKERADRAETAATRAEHIASRTQRSRRYSSEQWARAGRSALSGDTRDLRNRIELHDLPAPRHEDQGDGSQLLVLDGEKIASIEDELDALRADRDALAELLRMAGESLAPFGKSRKMFSGRRPYYDPTLSDRFGLEIIMATTEDGRCDFTLGQFRRARSILADIEARFKP